MNILVVAAHPDDEVLGCGGTIARLVREGGDVHILILGEGVTSRFDAREDAPSNEIKVLHDRCCAAGEILGAKEVRVRNLPDNRFDSVPLLTIVKEIEIAIDEIAPQVVYTQHGGDLNVDHERVYRATLIATRPTADNLVKTVYAYEVASSTEWAFQKFAPAFRPSVFVDISETLDVKIRALQTYESEVRAFPHPRSSEALRAAARRWGSVSGLGAAEAFELVRDIR